MKVEDVRLRVESNVMEGAAASGEARPDAPSAMAPPWLGRGPWLLAGSGCAVLVILALAAFGSGGRLTGPTSAQAAVAATAAPAPSLGALMSSTGEAAQTDRLGAFAAETPADTSGDGEGTAGADGAAGIDGANGIDGVDGAPGADGATGATGPAGFGLTASDEPTQSVSIWSPDGLSYRIVVRNDGIFLQGPTTTQIWSDSSHLQTTAR
jgi:hypothetical protein